jgi:putative glycosyltransferase (TIGR04348 family)
LKFLINTPAPRGSTKGNRITAERWSGILRELGHTVRVTDRFEASNSSHHADCLIALHAMRSAPAIRAFSSNFPERPIVLCLTGTDIHRDLPGERGKANQLAAIESLKIANQIVLLEPESKSLLRPKFARKVSVIFQSAVPIAKPLAPLKRSFEVSILGHLRWEKDPLRIAYAARSLPETSRIQVKHLGGAYTAALKRKAQLETERNARYTWLKERPFAESQRLLARSRLTVLTSRIEGAPSVFSEAIVNDVPILASRIAASMGMLGRNYPGLFDVGDTQQLTELMWKAETEPVFYRQLKTACRKLKRRFGRPAELKSWRMLVGKFHV